MIRLLDTDIVSQFRRKRPHPRRALWLGQISVDAVFLSAATVAEIRCGIGQVQEPAVASPVQAWLDGMIQTGQPKIADIDGRAAILPGRMWAISALDHVIASDPWSKRTNNGADPASAAIAISRHMIVATGDVDHFNRINVSFRLPGVLSPLDGTRAAAAGT